jgi:aspartate dehydrogenase
MTNIAVAVAGMGAVGMPVVRALARGIDRLSLTAVSARDRRKAATRLDELGVSVPILEPEELAAHADLVVECLPPALFERVARPAVQRGRLLLISSVGQLLAHCDLIEAGKSTGARILVPSGALAGLDGVRACAESTIHSARLVTRKPLASLMNAPFVRSRGIQLNALTTPLKLFQGNTAEAIMHFPANVNIAVALAFAGIGPQRTMVEIWADPNVERNIHRVEIESDLARITVTVEAAPSPGNSASSRLAGPSLVATLRKVTSAFVVGT